MGVENVFASSDDRAIGDVESMLDYIGRVKCSHVPAWQQQIPDVTEDFIPVCEALDFVWWDEAQWYAIMSESLLLPGTMDGSAEVEVDGRGERVYGAVPDLPCGEGRGNGSCSAGSPFRGWLMLNVLREESVCLFREMRSGRKFGPVMARIPGPRPCRQLSA